MATRLSAALLVACGLGGVGGCSSNGNDGGALDGGGGGGGELGFYDLSTAGGGGSGGGGGAGGSGGGGDMQAVDFWDAPPIPVAQNVMTFVFLNRTNGKFGDDEVYWGFQSGAIDELHSIAAAPTYDMPANSSGRMYFYICAKSDAGCTGDPSKSKYFDFIEHTIGPHQYNGNTTRVDAFGLKLAMRLHCSDGFDRAVGEDQATFAEPREATFQAFVDSMPAEFKPLGQAPHAPYRIVEPGAAGFGDGGTYAHYYDALVNEIWSKNGLTIAKPGPNGSGLRDYPDVSAAIFRHVGNVAGSFSADGKLQNKKLWDDASTFYRSAPAHYYARFWHTRSIEGKAYGFPYDDVGGYSTYVSHANPQYMLIAIGW
jgi:hypothetical protein